MKTRQQAGFSLIELLVAVLIMGIGILGVAALQVLSLQQNRAALYRAEAVQIGNSLMDRIRVNPNVVYAAPIDADPAATTDCTVNPCTNNQMRDFDIAQWKCSINSLDADGNTFTACDETGGLGIDGSLPEGAGSVSLVGSVYEVTVEWDDDADGTPTSITLRAQVN